MPTIVITTDYDGFVFYRVLEGVYVKDDISTHTLVGNIVTKLEEDRHRGFFRFPLTDLPVGATVTQVRFRVYCRTAGGAAHLLDVHPYNANGQADPQADPASDCYTRCAAGTPYIDDSTELRTTGTKWFTLPSQANTDVQNAKAANRFSLGLHEEGDNDPYAVLDALEYVGGIYAQLEITYTVPPAVGYSYSDGLVSVQVAG